MIIRRIESRFEQRRKRVGAYARVSTDKAEQEESFETQCQYYEKLIRSNPQWDYIRVYADTGKSGTSVNKRAGFQQMLEDARKGKVDIIYCKSISRFARNVADAQRYARELKGLEVEVRFEREALSTFDSSADIIFNILAAVAQEESRSISENTKWAYQKNAENGIRRLGNNRVLGYDVDKEGELVPNKDAWIIEEMFGAYADGSSLNEIVKTLNRLGAKRLRSKKPFTAAIVYQMLQNEIYVGDRVIQKEAPQNYLTKRPDTTEAFKSTYMTDAHMGIIDRVTWDQVKARLEATTSDRTDRVFKRVNTHFLYGILFCGECGAPYKRKTIRGKKIWRCGDRLLGAKGNGCKNRSVSEEEVLREVAEHVEWTGDEHIDFEAFRKLVSRIEITRSEMRKLAPIFIR